MLEPSFASPRLVISLHFREWTLFVVFPTRTRTFVVCLTQNYSALKHSFTYFLPQYSNWRVPTTLNTVLPLRLLPFAIRRDVGLVCLYT